MPIDFFDKQCLTQTSESQFGICDDDDENPAYIDTLNDNIWIATVLNSNSKNISFIAIDKCIEIPLINDEMPSRCDAMLICDNCLYVLELKNKRLNWQSSGIEQLESTIKQLMDSLGGNYDDFRLKKAFVANKKHPNFHVIENETMERFRNLYQVRLDLQAIIKIV